MKNLSLIQKNKLAQESDNELSKWRRVGSIAYLYQGKILKKIKEEKLYKYLGESPEFESFEIYVNSRGLDLRKAYYLIQIWTTFCEKFKYKPEELSDIHWTSLRTILPCVNETNIKELVEKARILTRTHLNTEIKQLKEGLSSLEELDQHKHEFVHIEYWRCRICGEKSMVKPKDDEMVK